MASIYEHNQQKGVMLVSVHAIGSRNPMTRLARRLVLKGLHVTLAINDLALKNHSSIVGGVHLEYFSDGLPEDHDRLNGDIDIFMSSLRRFGPGNLSALIGSCGRKFSCVITMPFLPWAADVAAELGLPCAMVWIQACTVYQIFNCFYNRINEFPTENNLENMVVNLPGVPSLRAEDLPSFVLPANTMSTFDSILKEVFCNIHKYKWVLGNSFMELEKDVIKAVNDAGLPFWPVGPIVPAICLGEEDTIDGDLKGLTLFKSPGESNCLEWLDKHPPASVVYISFGTLLFLSRKQIESIATGLKSSKRPFLWVVKLPENQETQKVEILEEIKEQGLIMSWSPQTAVLSHPSVGCFISHCGWNSLIETITAGVPMIACPQWTDQPTNAKLVTDVWRIGVKLKKNVEGLFDGEELERCVEEVLTGSGSEEFRKNAAELKRAACEAVADGGSSDKNIELFVDGVSSSCS
ncbi:UDP-glycosyltransferase 84B1 [Lactuca sativa]|uniref:UDP-glycosyltransferase 84B1 n=1 Tax=Lactuca sativa TaxID=4236 RepID=UPI000CC4B877|nr:UDP-glycosyltransferase 84B1 [Lactuca sativa]